MAPVLIDQFGKKSLLRSFAAEIACFRGALQFLGGLGGIGSHSLAESLRKVAVVAAGNAGATAALLLLHCLLPLEALVHLHHPLLAVVGAHFLVSSLIPSAWLLLASFSESLRFS
ncbi:hypothetical protein PIB30_085992 [Stylosanthes scabra]|uniref:Uncharacterized protein n=1 Tax=Stylosanthes scabra TaxID=79078 RepID=A0ABU6TVV6_9FABA|nr:hypothetical protein [Stylosanthes scabra]